MKKFSLLIITVLVLMTTACNSKKDTQTSGIDVTNLDTLISPEVDFYQFACGGWMLNNPLTGEYSRFGSFDKLAENNRKQLKDLIENIASKPTKTGTVEQKIGDIYNMAMDSIKLNQDGYAPVKSDLEYIASIKNKSELSKLIPELMLSGTDAYFTIYVDADPMSSSQNLLQTYQSGISLGQREYYLDKDEHTTNIRNKYKEHVTKMFELTGFSPEQAQKNMEAVLKIETRLATAAYDNVKLRDPYANYSKISIEEVQKLVPSIDWSTYFTTLGLKEVKEINASQKESLIEVENIITSEPLDTQIAYIQWKLIDGAAGYLSDDIYAQNFDFYGKTLSGKEEQSPRWKRAESTVNSILGEAVGQMYVKQYFPPKAKKRMLELVHNLQEVLGERIQASTWMSDETKTKAIEKLEAFYIKVGYPDKWREYSTLNIEKGNYFENIKRANRFEYAYMLSKVGKPVDKDKWHMTPQTVNAYYNPSTNEICFPAGILQYPFFDMNADDAFNYGAIGVVIGHEMTHGFDDQGRQYDKEGNLKDWWTEEDAKQFEERAKVMADFFDSIQVAPNVHANGKLTLGENIADYGGLQISYQAFKKATKEKPLKNKNNFTPEQRFFLSYANVWASNIRPEEILVRTKSDPHSLGKWRVNGALSHIDAWYEAFNIEEENPMFVPTDKRVSIW
ncbi:Neutral endopeptidase [termite gut metagenome]|uniref:Neutral endopeptidase n=1 Tax=termite gut metagenome TaxID=433724 RepID=A0A5J4SUL0_9ZZZZ